MAASVARRAPVRQEQPDSLTDRFEGKQHSLMLQMLRQAIDESGWKHEALAVELGLTNAAYLSRMLAGEKPWTLRHLAALPDDVEAIFFRLRSESLGQIVVQPVDFETARRHLVSGLVGVLSHRGLPEKAGQPLKAGLKEK